MSLASSKTIENLKAAFAGESQANRRYLYFAQKADVEGYNDVAAVFRSTAEGETGHAHGHLEFMESVGDPATGLPIGSTRDNLIKAADSEIASIESFYPGLLRKISGENHAEAIAAVQFAWGTEKQHRDKIKQIQRWSPTFFETVARNIDQKTGRYFVCQTCGATVNKLPADDCTICRSPSTRYRDIEPLA